jgi:putative phosphoesterase
MTKIAILSDTHDNVRNLLAALDQVRASGAETLLHCGDFCAPFMLDYIGKNFSGTVHTVFGNNDGDGRLLQMIASKHGRIKLHGIYSELEIASRKIAMIHYPEPARRIAQSGQFDLVCYGHNHQRHTEQIGACWLVNPGEGLGMLGVATWALYDTVAHTVETVEISG